MPERPQITMTKEELNRAKIPTNHVLVKMLHSAEGLKTKGGIVAGFNVDTVYAEGEDSHSANLAEVYARVYKVPKRLVFNKNDSHSMDWETDMELMVGDLVWFSILESKNSAQVLCDGVLYKSIPYADCYVAKRHHPKTEIDTDFAYIYEGGTDPWDEIIPLNGYVLIKPVNLPQLSSLDAISDTQIDKTRGMVAFIGNAPKSYLRDSYSHIDDLRVGDEVLFDKGTGLFYLERMKETATFHGDNQYFVVHRRKIVMVLNRTK